MEEQRKNRRISQKIFILLLFLVCGAFVIFFADKYRNVSSDLSSEEEINAALYPDDEEPSAIAVKADYKYDSKLKITGSAGFERHITQSLQLIWLYDKPAFKFIRENIYEIKSANSTSFVFENGIPVILISDENAYKSLTWCAGIISHHAFHAYARILKNRNEKNKAVPPLPGKKIKKRYEFRMDFMGIDYTDLNTIIAVENKASAFQMRVLEKIGAPKSEIRYIKKRNPKDFSISHDGAYSVNP
ncbi:MAG: hypothetical protein L6420_11335 [Elusimicrobia bacterium]|nr:hypothetical protein [Elusimicrobiota bacterium]